MRDGTGNTRNPVAIADIGRPHGLKGECHVAPIGRAFTLLQPPCEVLIGKGTGALRPLVLEAVTEVSRNYLCAFAGVADRESAEGLRGASVYVDTSDLPLLGKGEYYHFELEGMQVLSREDRRVVGRVRRLHNYPTVDALEVEKADGSVLLVPLREEIVGTIDREGNSITVDMSALDELA
jgi:16S rRNA processing protein RimM